MNTRDENDASAKRRLLWLPFLAAFLVVLPSLAMGLFLDDYVHLLNIEGRDSFERRLDLFDFATGDPDALQPLIERGPYPWFALPTLKVHFFRPLTSLTMVADRVLFGRWMPAYHMHSLIWYLLLVAAAWAVIGWGLPSGIAVLTLFVFAVDEGHFAPAAWWSNRNALVAAVPAFFAVAAYTRYREHHWQPGRPLALVLFVCGLLGGESALGALGFVFAYECFSARDRASARLAAVFPMMTLAVLYLLFYSLGGFGVEGSGLYVDPLSDTGRFLRDAPARLLALMGTQLAMVPVEVGTLVAQAQLPLLAASLLGVALVGVALRYAWRSLPPEEKRQLKWLLWGSLFATAPTLATFPSGRLLVLPSLGGAAAIAVILRAWWRQRKAAPRSFAALALYLGTLHLVISPLVWPALTAAIRILGDKSYAVFDDVPISGPQEKVVLLSASDPFAGFYPMIIREFSGQPRPPLWVTLSSAPFEHKLTRLSSTSIELEVLGGQMMATPFETLLRSPEYKLDAGTVVSVSEYRVEVLAAGDLGPTSVRFTFSQSLDSEEYLFLSLQRGRLRPVALPAVGESMIIPKGQSAFAHLL